MPRPGQTLARPQPTRQTGRTAGKRRLNFLYGQFTQSNLTEFLGRPFLRLAGRIDQVSLLLGQLRIEKLEALLAEDDAPVP